MKNGEGEAPNPVRAPTSAKTIVCSELRQLIKIPCHLYSSGIAPHVCISDALAPEAHQWASSHYDQCNCTLHS